MLTFIDDFSRVVWVYMLKHKDEMKVDRKKNQEVEDRQWVGVLFVKVQTLNCQTHTRHTPQQNGVVELMNRTLLKRTHCMFFNASLSKDFWAETVATTCYLVNRSSLSSIECKTSEEV